ncbi:MAG: hypothetical protein IKX20_02795 [Paludibacteraceae bacterium]|nr:hypothetical protein [Paludibacteraceae bacterium]
MRSYNQKISDEHVTEEDRSICARRYLYKEIVDQYKEKKAKAQVKEWLEQKGKANKKAGK